MIKAPLKPTQKRAPRSSVPFPKLWFRGSHGGVGRQTEVWAVLAPASHKPFVHNASPGLEEVSLLTASLLDNMC